MMARVLIPNTQISFAESGLWYAKYYETNITITGTVVKIKLDMYICRIYDEKQQVYNAISEGYILSSGLVRYSSGQYLYRLRSTE